MTAKPRVFTREATGLIREFNSIDLLLMGCISVFSIMAVQLQFPWFYGFNPGANFIVSIVIAAIPFVLLNLVYWAVGVITPRSGGDYVWTGRIFGPAVGFAWSASYMLTQFTGGFAGPTVGFSYGIASTFAVSGFLLNSPALIAAATWLSGSVGAFCLALLLTIFVCIVSLLGVRVIKAVIYLGWVFMFVGLALMWGVLSTTSPTVFASKWDAVLSSYSSYAGMMQVASKSGWSLQPSTFSATLVSLPIVSLFLLGGNYVNAISGEIKTVRRAIPVALMLSLVFGVVFWIVCDALLRGAVGSEWLAAVGYLYDNNMAAYSSAMPFYPSTALFLSLIVYPNAFLIFLIPITFVIATLPWLLVYFWFPTRYFFAWAFDRIIPTKLADVNDRFHSPHYAILLTTAISVVLIYAFTFTAFPSSFTIAILLYLISYIVPCLALAALPYVKKDFLELAPSFMRKRIGTVPVVTVLGIVTAICFGYMTYVSSLNPLIATLTTSSVTITVGVIILALLLYSASLAYHRSRGIDIRLAFKEIPPE